MIVAEEMEAEVRECASRCGSVDELSEDAYQWLYDKHVPEMPYGTAKARTGDPSEWLDEHVLPDYSEFSEANQKRWEDEKFARAYFRCSAADLERADRLRDEMKDREFA